MRAFRSQWPESVVRLTQAGFSTDDAYALRRISMTLHRWHELECGDGNDRFSECITRGRWSDDGFDYDEEGEPYLERHYHDAKAPRYYKMADRERGALKRLNKIMKRYPGWASYVQGDPRGCALYLLSPELLARFPDGANGDVGSIYNNGIAVYK